MEDAEAAEAAAEVTYDEKVAVGESEKAQLGYTPNAALAAIAGAEADQARTSPATPPRTLSRQAMATPVDPSEPLALSTDGDGVTTVAATCVVPAGDGGTLTVALVDDGGAEGVDQYGALLHGLTRGETQFTGYMRRRRAGRSHRARSPRRARPCPRFLARGSRRR